MLRKRIYNKGHIDDPNGQTLDSITGMWDTALVATTPIMIRPLVSDPPVLLLQ